MWFREQNTLSFYSLWMRPFGTDRSDFSKRTLSCTFLSVYHCVANFFKLVCILNLTQGCSNMSSFKACIVNSFATDPHHLPFSHILWPPGIIEKVCSCSTVLLDSYYLLRLFQFLDCTVLLDSYRRLPWLLQSGWYYPMMGRYPNITAFHVVGWG